MWLKQMVIDGFKSYCDRTVIKDWDRHFTAITGLNGSGKSNILDAICFVLGITNLQQVRVTNLQQLVYKEGQARVTRASVSLVLDNRDKSQSPLGYELYDEITVTRQVIIGGRNKYLINGQSAQLNRVRDLFLSVQLDVNNPHFLIMQGRITKVLNMKPMEILGMIQEAAGTKMYEMKKSQALKTMNKKQIKVNEINRILEEEITPQLDKLRREKTHYEKWSQNNSEIHRLERLIHAYRYMSNKDKIASNREEYQGLTSQIEETKTSMLQLKETIKNIDNEIEVKMSEKNKQEESECKSLIDSLNSINIEITRKEEQIKHKNETIKRENSELASFKKTLKNNEKLLITKEEESKQIKLSFADTNNKREYLENRINTLESSLLGMNNSDNDNDNEHGNDDNNNNNDGSLASQLLKSKKDLSKLESTLKTNDNRIKQLKKDIKNEENRASKLNRNFEKMKKDKETKEAQLMLLKQQLEDAGFDEKKQENLEREYHEKERLQNNLNNQIRSLQHDLRYFDFDYSLPNRNFNRNWVFGKLGKLFSLNDNRFAKAIEVTAGGKLYNVIVTTNDVGKQLLTNGNLRSRVTIIPLNKIQGHAVDHRTVARAKDLVGEENCHLALELVGYPNELDAAMKFAFGQTFVCSDLTSAKEVAFDRNIRKKTVTYEGEVYNPGGLLTGGSSGNEENILLKMSQYNEKQNELNELGNELRQLRDNLNILRNENERTKQMRENIEDLEQTIKDLNDTMADSAYSDIMTQIENKKEEIKQLNENKIEVSNKITQMNRKIEDLNNDMKNFKDRSKKESEFKKEILKCKKELKNLSNEITEMNENTDRITMEISDCKDEITDSNTKILEQNELINKLKTELDILNNELNEINNRKNEITNELKKAQKKLELQNKELGDLGKKKSRFEKKIQSYEISILEQTQAIKELKQQIKRMEQYTEKLLSENSWLKDENEDSLRKLYRSYGKQHSRKASMIQSAQNSARKQNKRGKGGNKRRLANGLTDSEGSETESENDDNNNNNNNNENEDIDMVVNNKNKRKISAAAMGGGMTQAVVNELDDSASDNLIFSELNQRLNILKAEQSQLNKQINHKVMSMFERAEAEYRDLIKKREIVKNDKKKIENVIAELDRKKEDTLGVTFNKVNEHFENIFSKLLPGTHCKLSITQDDNGNNLTLLDGLEVKVAFGDVWKESLSELSGGQRSLLALSLILSLLLFKPAPLYILDEIDAALDLSHTQNIGILLSKYFNKSQFIVVSLKEGMFNNANVIFRTTFVDGVSHVKRSVGIGIRNNHNNNNNNNNNNKNKNNNNSNNNNNNNNKENVNSNVSAQHMRHGRRK